MAENIYSPLSERLIASMHYQGDSNDCGPFTIATVLGAMRGIDIEPANLAREMDKPVWRGPILMVRRIPKWASFPWGIVDVFRSYGLKATWRFFAKPEELRQGLLAGKALMPIYGEWKPLWAHIMALAAWDAEKGWGFANTSHRRQEIDWETDEVFIRRWKAYANLLVEAENG